MRTSDPVSRYAARVYVVCGALAAAAVASSPLWACGRPDRIAGFLLGAAASVARFAYSVRLARRIASTRPARYGASRALSLLPIAAALVAAGVTEGIDLTAACAGAFLASAAAVTAAVLEARAAGREEMQ